MADLTGQENPSQSDGLSMLPTLLGEGEQAQHEYLYFEFIMPKAKPYTSRALRQGDWKVVQKSLKKKNKKKKKGGLNEFEPIELYNLKDDPGERNDLASEHPEILQKLEALMDEAHTPLKGGGK